MSKLVDCLRDLNQIKYELASIAQGLSSPDLEAIAEKLEKVATELRSEVSLLISQELLNASYDERWTAR